MKILFFASGREAAGVAEFELETSEALSSGEVWERLIAQFPSLEFVRGTARLARNGEYASGETRFHAEDEVAILPPVSGG